MILGTQAITRLRATETQDEYHNAQLGWDSPTSTVVRGCSVQPAGGLKYTDSRVAVTTLFVVWAPVDADVLDTDRIQYAGNVYELDGPVDRWNVGTGLDHLVLRLKKVSG